ALKLIRTGGLAEGLVIDVHGMEEVLSCLLGGSTIIYLDGQSCALAVGTQSLKQRQVQEATSQSVVRGPREGFTESLCDNTSLVRRRIQHHDLRMRRFRVGEETRTAIAVMYMEGKVDKGILSQLYEKLEKANLPS